MRFSLKCPDLDWWGDSPGGFLDIWNFVNFGGVGGVFANKANIANGVSKGFAEEGGVAKGVCKSKGLRSELPGQQQLFPRVW